MATPTDRRTEEIDVSTLERFTDSLVEAGVHGLFPGGSIGEFSSLTPDQNHTVIETVASVVGDRTCVFAGCGDTSVDAVVENTRTAAETNADVAVIVTPYYLSTTQMGLEEFFTNVAECSPLPIVLYNIPPLTGNAIEIETVISLADHPNIVGLKDTSGDLTYHHQVNEQTNAAFSVFQGATELAAASLELGADGIIAGPANIFPNLLARLYNAHAAGDNDAVSCIMNTVVVPMVSATSDLPTAAAIKHLVAVHGMDIGTPLPPLPPLTKTERAQLERTYRHVVEAIENNIITQ
ncbi:dihydrodipicolinate synthase family protein [Halocatena marina]|nr:dihydrodipicolinate synthase family protein [Halocatena marina]